MMTVKELRKMIENADENDFVFFMQEGADRDGYNEMTAVRHVKRIETRKLTEEKEKKMRWLEKKKKGVDKLNPLCYN